MMFANPELIPFTITSKTLAEEEATLEVMIEEVDVTPFTVEVSTLAAADSEFAFTKFAVVVATTPFTIEVRTKSLVVVEMVSVCEVPALMIDWRSVEVATPLIVVVSTVPEAESALEVMMLEVAVEPPTFEVRTLPLAERVFGTSKLATERFVPVALSNKKLEM